MSASITRSAGRLWAPCAMITVIHACSPEGVTEPPDAAEEPAAAVVRVDVDPPADTLPALGDTLRLTAVAVDASGAPVAGAAVSWRSSDEAVATVDPEGVVTAIANGSVTITASVEEVSGQATLAVAQRVAGVEVTPAAATLTTAGGTRAFTFFAEDANGNVVEDVPVLWQSSNHGVAVVDGSGVATAVGNGTATITALAGGVPGAASLTVDQRLARLVFLDEPAATVTAGEALDPALRVELQDADGRRVADAEVPVTMTVGTNPGGAALKGSRTVTSVAGVAVFAGLWLDRAGPAYTLSAAAADLDAVQSRAFDVLPASAHQVAFVEELEGDSASFVLAPVEVAVQDRFGNLVPDADHEVRLSVAESTNGASLEGTTTVSAAAGVARFEELELRQAGTYRLSAGAFRLAGVVSDTFSIVPALPNRLAVLAGPGTGEGQERLEPALQVGLVDRFGNVTPAGSVNVSVTLAGGAAGAVLSGTLSRTTVDGIATFDDLSVDRPGDAYVLLADAIGGFEAQESAPFDVRLTFADVTAGFAYSCGLTERGRAYCWGFNSSGQLGDGTTVTRHVPTPVAGGHRFQRLAAGGSHACGVTTRAEALCWGRNGEGQVGDGTSVPRLKPVLVAGVQDYVTIEAGSHHTCALTKSATARCWGLNGDGQLGDGTTTGRDEPVAVSTGAKLAGLALGAGHSCGLDSEGGLACWGRNSSGQLGDGTFLNRTKPTPVAGSVTFESIAAGLGHTCGTAVSALTHCWGANASGQLGDGSSEIRPEPVVVVTGLRDLITTTGASHTCGVSTSGAAYCWGLNLAGQLGDGTAITRAREALVAGALTFTALAAGDAHTCGVTEAGEAYCWGFNEHGQLGNGTTSGSPSPVRATH